jgi:Mg-chelatase subunit ChlD
LTIQGINATNLINATTDAHGRIYGTFISSNVSGNVTLTALSGSINASTNVEVKEDPFMSVSLYVTPPSVDTGGVINVTTIISIEGELPITRDTASAMLVLDRSGSMDPDYYAGSPIDVVTVIDRSGSMSGQPIIAARNAAKSFKNNLASNAQVGVVSYSDSSRVDIGLTLLNTSDNKALIDTAIDGISAGGWTAMGDGMADANTLLINGRSQSRKVMVVLTDGNTNSGSDQDGDNAVAIANANGITIYTIGLGTNLDESLLRGIASAAGGKYYNAPTSVDLQNIYNTIAQDISDYDVTEVQYGVDGFTPYDYNFQDSIEHYTLRFDGYDLDYTFDAGSEYGGSSAGECLIRINGDNFTTTPSQNTGTNNYAWDTYEYDITDYIVLGSNNITFYDYHDYLGYGLWTNEIRNVEILHNGTQVEYYAASNVLDGSGYSCSVNVSNPISSFSRSFLINESINDLKVQLDWQDNSSDIFLELTSPTGRVYGDGNDTTGYYFSNNSAYIWLHPLSYRYPEDDNDRVELGNWTVNVTGSVTGDGNFTISTYIDKKSATILSSHAFITSFDETKGDRAGLTLYSYDYINSTNKQTSYVHDNSSWVGYFTADNTAFYDFNVSWTDASALNIKLYDGVTLLSSSNGTGFSTVNSSLSNGDTYFIEVSKGSGSGTDTKFTIDVSSSILQTKMMAYYDYNGGASTPRYRKWDDPDWSIEKSANYLGGRPYYMVLESNPNHREMILGTSDDAYDVNLQVWDGDYWGSVIQVSNSTDAYSRRGFDIAYEQVSGDALAVFMNKSIDDGVARYRIWDGSSWSDGEATDATSPGAGDIGWVELASDPSSDEIILVTGDDERDIRAQVWDGSSWDNPVVITDNSRATSYKCFDVIYEQESGHAMLVWSDVVDNAVRYRAWNGNSWNPAKNISSLGESVYWIKMAADPNSDDIIMASLDLSNDIYVNTWNGNSWSSRTLIESNASTYSKRAVDVSFEQISGTGIVAWGNTSSDINTSYTSYKPKYITWDGASWSAESLASNITGTPQWVQLTSDPLSNDVYLMTSDSYSDINVQKWNGSAWGSALEVETSATSSYECFDLAISSQVVSPSSTAVSWSEWTADVVSTLDGSSLTHLGNTIDTFSAAGLTAIDEGMFSANNELSSVNGNSTIVLMTDGLDNSGYHSLLEEAQRAKANNTTIYTVGFGINESEIDPILAEIASITGGEYYFAPNSSVLESIFTGIAEQLTNFSAGGPVMTINVPYNYIAPQAAAKVTYVAGSANTTVGNSSYFVVPTGPGSGTSDPSVTLSTPKSSIEWQLPSMGPGEKWGLWYQLVVNGAGYIPVIMPDSSVTYTDLDGQNVTVYIPAGGSVPTGGSVAPLLSYGLGELKLVPENRLVKIDDQSEIELTLKDITGNSSYGYVVVYSSLGYFDTYENPVNVSVVGSNTIDFSSAIAGNAYITAYAYNINNASDVLMASDRIIVRPNGLITIS